jgi:hypothetical protein
MPIAIVINTADISTQTLGSDKAEPVIPYSFIQYQSQRAFIILFHQVKPQTCIIKSPIPWRCHTAFAVYST